MCSGSSHLLYSVERSLLFWLFLLFFFCWWMIHMKCEFFTFSFPKFLWQWLAASEARAVCIWSTIQSHGSKQTLVSLSVWALSALLLFRACLLSWHQQQLRTKLGTSSDLLFWEREWVVWEHRGDPPVSIQASDHPAAESWTWRNEDLNPPSISLWIWISM